ncbi:hypothetical protein [Dactylosporangium sp. CA-092794]|uniref:hypothetical protein n=1 Tax=Dactylosporangium sp. CA-092794 TaxID=3239929 RepID=UPI003D92342B
MTAPQPPNLASLSSFRGLFDADLRDLAAALLWAGCAHKLYAQLPELTVAEVFRTLTKTIPELARISFLEESPHARPARHVLYEAVQVLEHNRLVLWRYRGSEQTHEEITLTRLGRAAIMSGDIRSYLPH